MLDIRLKDLIQPIVEGMGFEYVGLELLSGHGMTVKLYVDADNGINLDECVLISRQVSSVLDVEDVIDSAYHLEVSSPGVDRPLFTLSDYHKAIGQRVKIRLHSPVDGRRNGVGELVSVTGDEITMKLDDAVTWVVEHSMVKKANLKKQI